MIQIFNTTLAVTYPSKSSLHCDALKIPEKIDYNTQFFDWSRYNRTDLIILISSNVTWPPHPGGDSVFPSFIRGRVPILIDLGGLRIRLRRPFSVDENVVKQRWVGIVEDFSFVLDRRSWTNTHVTEQKVKNTETSLLKNRGYCFERIIFKAFSNTYL